MAENFGGPVWHASGRGNGFESSRMIARDGLHGCGDRKLGQWEFLGDTGIYHVQRRMTAAEREQFGVPEPYDIRGTDEEQRRISLVLDEAPHLAAHLTCP